MEAEANLIACGEKIFAELRAVFQILHGDLPDSDFIGSGRFEQPVREFFFTRASAKRTEQLKQRAPAKEVKISRIRMRFIDKLLAVFSLPGPAIFKPSEAALVEGNQRIALADSHQDQLMEDGQDDKNGNRDQQPGDSSPLAKVLYEEEYSEGAKSQFG